jgi:hypothetical protein
MACLTRAQPHLSGAERGLLQWAHHSTLPQSISPTWHEALRVELVRAAPASSPVLLVAMQRGQQHSHALPALHQPAPTQHGGGLRVPAEALQRTPGHQLACNKRCTVNDTRKHLKAQCKQAQRQGSRESTTITFELPTARWRVCPC